MPAMRTSFKGTHVYYRPFTDTGSVLLATASRLHCFNADEFILRAHAAFHRYVTHCSMCNSSCTTLPVTRRYDPTKLVDGWNTVTSGDSSSSSEQVYYISNPAQGLWAVEGSLLQENEVIADSSEVQQSAVADTSSGSSSSSGGSEQLQGLQAVKAKQSLLPTMFLT
jgi:hypothetical protein